MSKNIIIIITGVSATGKTTLGKKLSHKYKFPFIGKDELKECMFDNLSTNDKAWSLKVSATSHRVMDYVIEEELKAGHSIIVESNFKKEIDSDRFRKFQMQYGCELVQVLCWADGEVLYDRFMSRIDTGDRHAGHVEAISSEEIRKGFIESGGRIEPLDINGTTVELDMTDFESVDYVSLYKAVEKARTQD